MEHRLAFLEIDGQTQLVTVEKHCGPLCPCEKGNATSASITLANLDSECSLQRIPGLIRGALKPQIDTHWELYTSTEFEQHCRTQRNFHLSKMAESVRYLANPCNRFLRSKLIHKIWNEQAAKVYSEYLAANAITGSGLLNANAMPRQSNAKNISEVLQNGFTVEQLALLIADLVPNWKDLNKANKDKKQTSLAGVWKRVFPLAALALMERGHLPRNISARALALLFSKHFGLSDCVKTFQNWMKPDQVSTPDYLEMANDWLDKNA